MTAKAQEFFNVYYCSKKLHKGIRFFPLIYYNPIYISAHRCPQLFVNGLTTSDVNV